MLTYEDSLRVEHAPIVPLVFEDTRAKMAAIREETIACCGSFKHRKEQPFSSHCRCVGRRVAKGIFAKLHKLLT